MGPDDFDDFDTDREGRPPESDSYIPNIRTPGAWKDAAQKRLDAENAARGQRRSLADVLKAFLFGYGLGEYPHPGEYPGEGKRAKKKPKRRK